MIVGDKITKKLYISIIFATLILYFVFFAKTDHEKFLQMSYHYDSTLSRIVYVFVYFIIST